MKTLKLRLEHVPLRACLPFLPRRPMEGKTLEEFWRGEKVRTLSPQMQALAWGMNEAGMDPCEIEDKVTVIGGGRPSRQAVEQLVARIAARAPRVSGVQLHVHVRPGRARARPVPSPDFA